MDGFRKKYPKAYDAYITAGGVDPNFTDTETIKPSPRKKKKKTPGNIKHVADKLNFNIADGEKNFDLSGTVGFNGVDDATPDDTNVGFVEY